MARDPRSVFVNVPFDEPYEPLFEALVFVVMASGYLVRCALEEDDSGDIRIDKLDRLIRLSARSIHDLSRTQVADGGYPRFNMPFELGLAIGLKRFGEKRLYRKNGIKIMVSEPYRLPTYLSDLGGNDPSAHHDVPAELIKIVRNYLHESPEGVILQGPESFAEMYTDFKARLPFIAEGIKFKPSEVRGFRNYRTFLWCVREYLRTVDLEAFSAS